MNKRKTLVSISILISIFSFSLIIFGKISDISLVFGLIIGIFFCLLILYKPIICLYVFVFLTPFEEITLIDETITLLRIVGWLLLFVWVISKLRKRKFPKISKSFVVLFLFLIWGSLSYFWAYKPEITITRIPTFVQLIALFWLISDMVDKPIIAKKIFWSYTIGVILAAAVTLINFFGSNIPGFRAAISSSGSPNHLPLSMLPAFFWLWVNFISSKKWNKKLKFIFLILPIITVVFVSASRGTLFALIVTLAISLIWKDFRYQSILVLFLGLFGLLILTYVNDPELISRFSIDRIINDRGAGRFDIWLVGLHMAKNNLILGYGLDNFPWVFGDYYAITQTIRTLSYFRASHNIFLGLLVELGIIGLGLFITFILFEVFPLISKFSVFIRENWRNSLVIQLSFAVFLSICSLLIGSFFLDILYRKYLWIFLGLVSSINFINQQNFSNKKMN